MEPLNLKTAMAIVERSIAMASPADCPLLVGELARLQAAAWARMMTSTPDVTDDDLLTVPQVALRLKLSDYRVYELVRQGHLTAVRLGKAVRIRPSAIAEYLAKPAA